MSKANLTLLMEWITLVNFRSCQVYSLFFRPAQYLGMLNRFPGLQFCTTDLCT